MYKHCLWISSEGCHQGKYRFLNNLEHHLLEVSWHHGALEDTLGVSSVNSCNLLFLSPGVERPLTTAAAKHRLKRDSKESCVKTANIDCSVLFVFVVVTCCWAVSRAQTRQCHPSRKRRRRRRRTGWRRLNPTPNLLNRRTTLLTSASKYLSTGIIGWRDILPLGQGKVLVPTAKSITDSRTRSNKSQNKSSWSATTPAISWSAIYTYG